MEMINIRFSLPEPEHREFKTLVAQRRTNLRAVAVKLVRGYMAAARAEAKGKQKGTASADRT